jgi:hypothetical protein
LIHIGMDQFKITISMINYLLYVIIIMLIYGIKIIRKMPIILTAHRPPTNDALSREMEEEDSHWMENKRIDNFHSH